MSEYLTTKELAALLRIKERKVYDLASTGQIPCSRAHGKLLFPRADVEAWVARGGGGVSSPVDTPRKPQSQQRANVFLGSHDPLLEWALRESRCGLPCFLDGSLDGLTRFNAGEGIAAGLHLFDADTSRWNVPHVRDTCGDTNVVLISWAQRARGFIVADEVASTVRDVTDLRGRRVVARNSEAGSQMHFDHITAQARVGHDEFDIVETVRTETDAALCILEGKADVAFGLKSLAALYKLCFVPVAEERYDLIIDRRAYFEEPLQTLFAFCGTATFHEKAAELAGYDVSGLGQVRWNGA